MNKIVILMILIESFFSKPRKGDHEAAKEAIPAAAAEFEGNKHCPRYAGDKSKYSGQASDGANDQSRRQPRRSQ